MQLSLQTTTQNASLFSLTSGSRANAPAGKDLTSKPEGDGMASALEAASKKADDDAAVIAALREAVENGKDNREDFTAERKRALADVDDYRKAANQLRSALGLEETEQVQGVHVEYESASISKTMIEADFGGEKVSGELVSIERVSFNSKTGLSVSTASASNITSSFGGVTANYQSASVSSLYAGTGKQVSQLGSLFA